MKYYFILFIALCVSLSATAQPDTSKPSIDITSAYKPVLRNAVKINFSGSQLAADTTKPRMTYNIPAQNLFYSYQPVALRPLALAQDTNLYLGNRRYLKAGFGSFSTPYLDAGVSFGDGKKSLINLYANYIGSKGNIENQDYSHLNVKGTGSFFTPKNEIYGSVALRNDNYYLYGYDHTLFQYDKKDIRQQFQDVTVTAGFRNTVSTRFLLSYNPNVKLNFFTNVNKATETNIMVNIPVEKKFGEQFTVKVDFKGQFTNYSTRGLIPDNVNIGNNVIQFAPSVLYSKPLFKIHAGITPTWENGNYIILPDVFFEAQLKEKVFMLQGGVIGRVTQNTYRHLTNLNPYLLPVSSQINTTETEYYGGIKASIGPHFNFSAKAGWISYRDIPLFINDTAFDGKTYSVSNESRMNNLRIHGDFSYINQDKFTLNGGVTLNGYTGMQTHSRAWNTLPFEARASLRWWAFQKLVLKSDLYIFGGGNSLAKGNTSKSFGGGTDLSAGAEYQINKQFSAWIDVNNVLNDTYQRWMNYPVYGLNLMGGIIIRF
jgi:hypothetical protein